MLVLVIEDGLDLAFLERLEAFWEQKGGLRVNEKEWVESESTWATFGFANICKIGLNGIMIDPPVQLLSSICFLYHGGLRCKP